MNVDFEQPFTGRRPVYFGGGGGGGGGSCTASPTTWGSNYNSDGSWAGGSSNSSSSGRQSAAVVCTLTATEQANHSTTFSGTCSFVTPSGAVQTVSKTMNSAEFASCMAIAGGVSVTVDTFATPLAGIIAGAAANYACQKAFQQSQPADPAG